MMPEMIPTNRQMMTVVTIMGTEMKTGKSSGPDSIRVRIYTKRSPKAPPTRHKMVASNRNSNKMVLFLAPMAFLRPMMGRRSLTVTNMILAIPNIPTIRLMPPMMDPTILMVIKDWDMALLNASTVFRA